jgi:uncharacterized repeat protein (TIGR01451 family)
VLNFTSDPFIARSNQISPQITIAARSGAGDLDTNFNDTVTLATSSPAGQFSVSDADWVNTTVIALSGGTGSFYYIDSQTGSPVITAYRSLLIAGTQTENIAASGMGIVSSPFTVSSAGISPQIKVVTRDGAGNTETTFSDTMNLSSSSPKGKFSVSNTTWSDTTIITFCLGTGTFYYKDTRIGNPSIAVSRSDLGLSDNQTELVIQPLITITKFQENLSTGANDTSSLLAISGDTVEYTITISNYGTETATGVVITDTFAFDTAAYLPLYFVSIDTFAADSWTYAVNTPVNWQTWGSIPPAGSENVKGLMWRINTLGVSEQKQVKFRVRVK